MVDAPSGHSDAARALERAGQKSGTLVSFSVDDRAGWIESDDGDLYFFSAADVVSHSDIPIGSSVRFLGAEGLATEVDHASPSITQPVIEKRSPVRAEEAPPTPTPSPAKPIPSAPRSAPEPARTVSPPEPAGPPAPPPKPTPPTPANSNDTKGTKAPTTAPEPKLPPTKASTEAGAEARVAAPAPPAEKPRSTATPPSRLIVAESQEDQPGAPGRQILRGQLVSYGSQGRSGWIQGEDSKLYGFGPGDALDPTTLVIGQGVLFHSFDEVTATCVVSLAKGEDPQVAMAAARAAAKARERAREEAKHQRVPRAVKPAHPGSISDFLGQHGLKIAAGLGVVAILSSVALFWKYSMPSSPVVPEQTVAVGPDAGQSAPPPAVDADPDSDASAEPAATPVIPTEDKPRKQLAAEPEREIARREVPATPPSKAKEKPEPVAPAKADAKAKAKPSAVDQQPDSAVSGDEPRKAELPDPEPLAAEARQPLPDRDSPPVTAASPPPTPVQAANDSPTAEVDVLTGADLPLPRAPQKDEALSAWWQDQSIPGALNVNFAGHLSSRPAIVLAFDGIFSGRESFNTFISVTDASGEPMHGNWEVGPNRTSLILPVPPGRYFVSIGAGLSDNRGRKLGRRLSGVLRIL